MISASQVKELRKKTNCGIMDCKRALANTEGDTKKAVEYLRKEGIKIVDEKCGRKTSEGIIYSYIHKNGRIGVLLELSCETDFVARTNEFKKLAKEIALQIVRDNEKIIKNILNDDIRKFGENIRVERFVKFDLCKGEE